MKNRKNPEKKCAFVVEDDDALRKLYTFLLQQEAYDVKACPSVASFTQSIKVAQPSIIIMDLGLPDGSGLDLCEQLKADPKTAQIPILILSGHSDLALITKNCHADAVMTKPFDLEEFLASIDKLAS